jgi:hypothetical protein
MAGLPILKREQFNDQWKVSFVNQVRAQDVGAVLNATYSPSSPVDAALFQEKPKYLYDVLEVKVATSKGKLITWKYKSTYDDHEVELIAPHDSYNPPDPPDYITKITPKYDHNCDKLRPFFGWLNTEYIKKTFEHTTQYTRLTTVTNPNKAFTSSNPALNFYLFNYIYDINTTGVPLTRLTGSTTDISSFHCWQLVSYKCYEASFPSDSKEALGHIVGISEHCGHAQTYKILNSDTEHIIYRSLLRPATPTDANLRAGMFGGEQDIHNVDPIIISRHDYDIMDESKLTNTAASASSPLVINPGDLIGRSFLMDKHSIKVGLSS